MLEDLGMLELWWCWRRRWKCRRRLILRLRCSRLGFFDGRIWRVRGLVGEIRCRRLLLGSSIQGRRRHGEILIYRRLGPRGNRGVQSV